MGYRSIVGLVRFNGYPMGVVASDCRHINGGAMTADGCDKLKRHLDLCDLFHLPVLNLIDSTHTFNDGTVYSGKRGENYIYEGLILLGAAPAKTPLSRSARPGTALRRIITNKAAESAQHRYARERPRG